MYVSHFDKPLVTLREVQLPPARDCESTTQCTLLACFVQILDAISTVHCGAHNYICMRGRGGLRTRLRKTTDSQVLVWHSSRVATSFVFLGWRRPTWLYHFLRASHHQSVNLRVQPSHAPCVQCRRRTCSALNLTRPIVSFSAIEIYWESESKPTYSASESRCWFTAHSLRSRQATNEPVFSPKAGKQATGVEGVRAYYLVVSAWPVPTYLDCKCSSCACCEYLSCDVIRAIECAVCGAHHFPGHFHIHIMILLFKFARRG